MWLLHIGMDWNRNELTISLHYTITLKSAFKRQFNKYRLAIFFFTHAAKCLVNNNIQMVNRNWSHRIYWNLFEWFCVLIAINQSNCRIWKVYYASLFRFFFPFFSFEEQNCQWKSANFQGGFRVSAGKDAQLQLLNCFRCINYVNDAGVINITNNK